MNTILNSEFNYGVIAKSYLNLDLPVIVLKSSKGYYLGTANDQGPISRESEEYFKSAAIAEKALAIGHWTQRLES